MGLPPEALPDSTSYSNPPWGLSQLWPPTSQLSCNNLLIRFRETADWLDVTLQLWPPPFSQLHHFSSIWLMLYNRNTAKAEWHDDTLSLISWMFTSSYHNKSPTNNSDQAQFLKNFRNSFSLRFTSVYSHSLQKYSFSIAAIISETFLHSDKIFCNYNWEQA